jgi:hypothetical protein
LSIPRIIITVEKCTGQKLLTWSIAGIQSSKESKGSGLASIEMKSKYIMSTIERLKQP